MKKYQVIWVERVPATGEAIRYERGFWAKTLHDAYLAFWGEVKPNQEGWVEIEGIASEDLWVIPKKGGYCNTKTSAPTDHPIVMKRWAEDAVLEEVLDG